MRLTVQPTIAASEASKREEERGGEILPSGLPASGVGRRAANMSRQLRIRDPKPDA